MRVAGLGEHAKCLLIQMGSDPLHFPFRLSCSALCGLHTLQPLKHAIAFCA